MKTSWIIFTACIFLSLAADAHKQDNLSNSNAYTLQRPDSFPLIAKNATLVQVSNQFRFTEGPAVDKQGNVFFTDQPNDNIWKIDTRGQLSLFMSGTGRSNGLYFDSDGNLVSCADENNELWSISPDKKITVLLSPQDSRRLNGPNDLWIDKTNGIYFTDPLYKRPYWKHTAQEAAGEYLYFFDPVTKKAQVVDTIFKKPNGIIGSPDGRYLYVADIAANLTYRYTITSPGKLSDRIVFAPLGSDGMTIDRKGNIYLTGKGVTVFDSSGKKIGHIDVPENWTANICFGGKKRKQLFITASKSVYTLKMKVKGAY